MEEELIKLWLTAIAQHSVCIFVAFACLPIKLNRTEPKTTTLLRLHWSVKLILYALLITVGSDGRPRKAVWYSFVIYRLIDITVGFCIDWVVDYINIESQYMVRWKWSYGRRWINIVSNILSQVIYRKLRPAVEPTIGVPMAPLTDVLAALVVSGMMSGIATGAVLLVGVLWWFYPQNGVDVRVHVEECPT